MAKKRKAGEEKSTPQPQPQSEKNKIKIEEEEEKIDSGEENEEQDQILEEDFKTLMEPFSKEQLIHILRDLASNDANILADIRKLADKDPAHRKIFVRGLGWDTTTESLKSVFSEYGELEECNVIMDKGTGKSKGYGFITYKHMDAAHRAMKEPSKKVDNRIAACQMACLGPVPQQATSDPAGRKIYVSNVPADMAAEKLLSFFSKFGEVEEGPLGFDKQTGKSRGFALFIYKTAEGAKKVLEEPNKNIDGHAMHCKRATENYKQKFNAPQTVPAVAGALDPNDLALAYGKGSSLGAAYGLLPLNQVAAPGFSNAFNAILASQNQSFASTSMDASRLASMNPPLASSLNSSSFSQAFSPSGQSSLGLVGSYGMHSSLGPYGSQQGGIGSVNPQMLGVYGSQGAALQGLSPYQSQQLSQSGLSRTSQQTGGSSLGGMSSYLPY